MKKERVMNNSKAILLEREEILPGVFRFLLYSPDISRDALPGQFVQLETDDGPFPVTRRPFTFNRCSPEKGEFEIVFDVVGRGTRIMSESRVDDHLGVLGPLGNGYRPDPGKWLLVGGGMGAAGFPFLCRNVDVALTCIGAVSGERVLLVGDGDVRIITEDGSLGEKGLVTDLLRGVSWDDISNVAVCGPLPMMDAVFRSIPSSHSSRVQVSAESNMGCGWGVCEGCVIPAAGGGYLKCCTDGPVFRGNDIDWKKWIEVIQG